MSGRKSVVIAALLVGLAPARLVAESFRNPPARPLLVVTTYSTTISQLSEPPDPRVYVNALYVFADRTLIQNFNYSPEPFGIHPQISSQTRGRIPNPEWHALLSRMTEQRIDTHDDCRIAPIGPPEPFRDSIGETVIRWYGRQGRRNTFTVSYGGDSRTFCEVALYELLGAISNATAKVVAANTSEYFSLP